MKTPHPAWQRLVSAARSVDDPSAQPEASAPFGFATRVAALAMSASQPAPSLFERFSWRALGVAGLLALACIAANYSAVARNSSTVLDEDVLNTEDTAARLLGLS
jgi:hypothetical protein